MAAKTDHIAWLKALTRAALPGTVRVVVTYTSTPPDQIAYALTCFDAADAKIGDTRDYDMLKSIMSPIEKLCTCEVAPLTVELNIEENELNFKNSV